MSYQLTSRHQGAQNATIAPWLLNVHPTKQHATLSCPADNCSTLSPPPILPLHSEDHPCLGPTNAWPRLGEQA